MTLLRQIVKGGMNMFTKSQIFRYGMGWAVLSLIAAYYLKNSGYDVLAVIALIFSAMSFVTAMKLFTK